MNSYQPVTETISVNECNVSSLVRSSVFEEALIKVLAVERLSNE